jgi:hypothetical protein
VTKTAFACALTVAALLLGGACSDSNGKTTTAPPTARVSTQELADDASPEVPNRCRYRPRPLFDGSNWRARVSGISCAAAGQFVQFRFFRTTTMRQVVRTPRRPGIADVAGWDCAWRIVKQPGWFSVHCSRDHALFNFHVTP